MSRSKGFVDIEAEPRKMIPSIIPSEGEDQEESEDTIDSSEEETAEETAEVTDHFAEEDLIHPLIGSQPLMASQPRGQIPIPALKQHAVKKAVKFSQTEKTPKTRTPRRPIQFMAPQPIINQDVLYRRGKGRVEVPRNQRFPTIPLQEEIFAQSRAGGWAEESDSEVDTDVFREVRKMKMDSSFQIYLIVGLVILVLSVVGSVRFYEFLYGKPEIPENTFDFMKKKDGDL